MRIHFAKDFGTVLILKVIVLMFFSAVFSFENVYALGLLRIVAHLGACLDNIDQRCNLKEAAWVVAGCGLSSQQLCLVPSCCCLSHCGILIVRVFTARVRDTR